LRELTQYLARTCFPEIAVPQATADLVDVAATAAPGCRSAGRSPAEAAARQDAFWEMHDALFADQGRLEDRYLWTRAERLGRLGPGRRALRGRTDARTRCVTASETTSAVWVKAGVATTSTLFATGERHTSPLDVAALERLIQQPS
jgi:protein-disulfide isomerase